MTCSVDRIALANNSLERTWDAGELTSERFRSATGASIPRSYPRPLSSKPLAGLGAFARGDIVGVSWEVLMDWRQYIVVDSNVLHGKARIEGTRVPVSVVLDNLAAGKSPEEIIEAYQGLTTETVRAAIAYAADLASERVREIPA